jgi:putative transposase
MPARNTRKIFIENGYYHIYNRGVEQRVIFRDERDYATFLRFLKEALSPPLTEEQKKQLSKSFTLKGQAFKGIPRQPKNLHKQVELLAYALMPNHFHLLLRQKSKTAVKDLLQSVATRYSMYFNRRYKRTGKLFENVYKAIEIDSEPYLLHITRYIHLNPKNHVKNLTDAYSSYPEYLKMRNSPWVKPDFILALFSSRPAGFNSYRNFVEEEDFDSAEMLGRMALDESDEENI